MNGKDENEEEVQFKVADRRKFNPDGSIREGVVLDAEPPNAESHEQESHQQTSKPVETMPAITPAADLAEASVGSDEFGDIPAVGEDADLDEDIEALDGEDIPGAKDPASFVNFLSTIATNAAAALGAMPHPATGQRSLDLDSGKYWLDVIAMLRDKTNGNLHPQESRLIEGLLADLRMQYVHLVRATEEKLKAQAAAKFSGDDLLGKKR